MLAWYNLGVLYQLKEPRRSERDGADDRTWTDDLPITNSPRRVPLD